MNAAYLEAGYAFPVAMQSLTAIQPYVLYEYWDKSADTDADSEFDFFSAGVNFSLSAATKIKMQYSLPTTTPDGLTEEPSSFVARLQIAY
jgi:hemolysin activation/secretion protein